MESNIKPNPEVELKEYKVISKFLEKNDDNETAKDIDLPTPESLQKLCSPQIVKDYITFSIEKYKSAFESKKDKDSEEEKFILNLDNIAYIKNGDILPYVLIFIGGINSTNTIYDFFDESVKNPPETCHIDNSINYLEYLNAIIDFLKISEKVSVPFAQMDFLFKSLDELGITIHIDDKNTLYRSIKDAFLSMEKNKILLILAPSNNFWIKSEKNSINDQNYDIKLNNHNNIFYNKKFIDKFLTKVITHPRCTFGLLCSMNYKNLKNCWDGLEKQFSAKCPKKVILLDQKVHESIMLDPDKKKPTFYRNMKKIIEFLKKEKNIKDKNTDKDGEEEDNIEYFNEKNILILESEEDKIGDTKSNSIFVNLFNEQYLEFNEKDKEAIDLEGDKIINYIIKLLETCTDDIRDYINRNKITDEYSRV